MAGKTQDEGKTIDVESFKEEEKYLKYPKVEGLDVDYTDKQNGRRESASLRNLDVKGN